MSSILTETEGRVGVIVLNRPEVLNAWNASMRAELIEAFRRMDEDPAVGAIVLTGAGDRAFGAGQDLREAKSFDPARAEEWVGEWERLYDVMRALGKPIVAAVNGVAAGSAFQVALLCDIRIGHEGVTMGQPEIHAGITSTTGPWIMREILGLGHAIDLTLTGRMLDAEECLRLGALTRIVPRGTVLEEAKALAAKLAASPPVALKLNRDFFRQATEAGFREALARGVVNQRQSYASGEPAAMMERFLAERARRKETRG